MRWYGLIQESRRSEDIRVRRGREGVRVEAAAVERVATNLCSREGDEGHECEVAKPLLDIGASLFFPFFLFNAYIIWYKLLRE